MCEDQERKNMAGGAGYISWARPRSKDREHVEKVSKFLKRPEKRETCSLVFRISKSRKSRDIRDIYKDGEKSPRTFWVLAFDLRPTDREHTTTWRLFEEARKTDMVAAFRMSKRRRKDRTI